MRSVLEEFIHENVLPEVRRTSFGSEMEQAKWAAEKNEKYLLENLSGAVKEVFQKYIEARKEIDQLAAVKNLADGYKLGLTLTAEAFVSRGELVGE